MALKEKDDAMDAIYECAREIAQDKLGLTINDDAADTLVDAISAYLGDPD